MNLFLGSPVIERAQPWLGTLVSIRAEGLAEAEAHAAIDAAFSDITRVHQLMSFHAPESDVSRLNREAARHPIPVHPWTYRVLEDAQRFSHASEGCFDVSVAAVLVDWGMLPQPIAAGKPQQGSWRDIEMLSGNRVFFHRPLWIDLGGIAKGFAVDCAVERLRACGASRAVVNAGGDIRVEGNEVERIRLGAGSSTGVAPVLEITDGSVASSYGALRQGWCSRHLCGPHVDGSQRAPAPLDRFACVVAERCMVADALTKIVMVRGAESANLLQQFGASAHIKDPNDEWRLIGSKEMEIG